MRIRLRLMGALALFALFTLACMLASTAPTVTAPPNKSPTTTQVLTLNANTELRDKAGSDPTSQVQGLLPAGAQFTVKARTADSQWVRIELPDGTNGWIAADATGLSADQLVQVPTAAILLKPLDTLVPISTSTVAPITTQVLTLNANTELRDKAGSDPASQVEGTLQAGAQFFVKARTADSQWTRIELQEGTRGWIAADTTGLSAAQLAQVPLAATLLAPTLTPGPTEPPAMPTGAAVQEPLGFSFSFDHCDYSGSNYTCNVTVWGSGGSGSYFFAMQSPDTGLWDQHRPIDRTVFPMRSRRCKIQVQELRVWDSAGNYLTPNPNITMDPNAIASLFPGGSCTP